MQSLGQNLERTQDIVGAHAGVDSKENLDYGNRRTRGTDWARDFHLDD